MKIIVANCESEEKSLKIFNYYKDFEQKGEFRLMFLGVTHNSIPMWQCFPHLTFVHCLEICDRLNIIVLDEFFEENTIIADTYYNEQTELPYNFEIIVAKYREDISWLKQRTVTYNNLRYIDRCHIYDKGGDTIPDNDTWRWEKIENVGRESHTYLKHIIDNYDSLADVTVFTQGNIEEHGKCGFNLECCIKNAQNNGFDQLIINVKPESYNNWGMMNHSGKWLLEKKSGNMRSAKLTFGEFYEESIKIYYAAIFAVRKDIIKKYPLSKYIQMIKFVDDHINPEEGHYFERLWNNFWTS